jgi:hypothetical protein
MLNQIENNIDMNDQNNYNHLLYGFHQYFVELINDYHFDIMNMMINKNYINFDILIDVHLINNNLKKNSNL